MKYFLIPLKKKIVKNILIENKRRFGYHLLLVNNQNPSYYCLRVSAFSDKFDQIQLFYEEQLILEKYVANNSEINFSMDGNYLLNYFDNGNIIIWQLNQIEVIEKELKFDQNISQLQILNDQNLIILQIQLNRVLIINPNNQEQSIYMFDQEIKKESIFKFQKNHIIFVNKYYNILQSIHLHKIIDCRIIKIGNLILNKIYDLNCFYMRDRFFYSINQNYEYGTKYLYNYTNTCNKFKIIRKITFLSYGLDFIENDNLNEISLISMLPKCSLLVTIIQNNGELISLGKTAKQTVTDSYMIYSEDSKTEIKIKGWLLLQRIVIQ